MATESSLPAPKSAFSVSTTTASTALTHSYAVITGIGRIANQNVFVSIQSNGLNIGGSFGVEVMRELLYGVSFELRPGSVVRVPRLLDWRND